MNNGLSICIMYNAKTDDIEQLKTNLNIFYGSEWAQLHENFEILLGIVEKPLDIDNILSLRKNFKSLRIIIAEDRVPNVYTLANTILNTAKFDTFLIAFDYNFTWNEKNEKSIAKTLASTANNFRLIQKNGEKCNNIACVRTKSIIGYGGFRTTMPSACSEYIFRTQDHESKAEIKNLISTSTNVKIPAETEKFMSWEMTKLSTADDAVISMYTTSATEYGRYKNNRDYNQSIEKADKNYEFDLWDTYTKMHVMEFSKNMSKHEIKDEDFEYNLQTIPAEAILNNVEGIPVKKSEAGSINAASYGQPSYKKYKVQAGWSPI